MRIRDLKTFVVGTPPPHKGGRYWIFVKLTTDDGIEGIGEVYSPPFHPDAIPAMVADVFERHVLGMDPFRIERLWRTVYFRGYTGRADLSLMAILSGIETALWDIVGKAVGKPVHALLGGRIYESVRAYTYIYPGDADTEGRAYTVPEEAARRAAHYAGLGFTAIKFDPLGPYTPYDPRNPQPDALDRAEAITRAVREAVGGRCDLLIGTHGQMTAAGAIRLARRLEPLDPLWLEEPVPPENVEEMARVARSTTIPIATGERLAGKYEFARVLAAQAAAILQPALGRAGGLLEGKKIAAIAEAHYAQMAPHLYCGPVEAAANVHLDACSPNFLVQESIETWGGFHAEILKRPLVIEDGRIAIPEEPGLGVELDEAVAAAHPYSGETLHLVPQEEPI